MRDERECPYCAEMILTRAKMCKHCGRDVTGTKDQTIPKTDEMQSSRNVGRVKKNLLPLSAPTRSMGANILTVAVVLAAIGAGGAYRFHWFEEGRDARLASAILAPFHDPKAIPPELLNGRFEEVGPEGKADTMTFISGWWTHVPPDSIVINPKDTATAQQTLKELVVKMFADSLARLSGVSITGEPIDPSPPFELVQSQAPNPNGTITIARRHGIGVKTPLCQLMTTGKANEWTCLISTISKDARALTAKGIASISFARDADGFYMPAQPATSMIAWRLNPLP